MRHQGPRLSSRARVCDVLAGGVLKEVCVLCWSVPPSSTRASIGAQSMVLLVTRTGLPAAVHSLDTS